MSKWLKTEFCEFLSTPPSKLISDPSNGAPLLLLLFGGTARKVLSHFPHSGWQSNLRDLVLQYFHCVLFIHRDRKLLSKRLGGRNREPPQLLT